MKKIARAFAIMSVAIFFPVMVQASEQKTTFDSEQTTLATGVEDAFKQQFPAVSLDRNDSITSKEAGKPDKTFEIKSRQPERKLPANYKTITIIGEAKATESQAIAFIKKYTKDNNIKFKVSPEDMVRFYYEESSKEGIRADLALCQAILETGFFKFGGTVKPEQNNFCGLGTTSKTVAGATFKTPAIGVRAHIQHLLAYSSEREPKTKIVDPRYHLVQKMRKTSGYLTTWHSLNGMWAMSGEYSEKIFDLHSKMLTMPRE
ncbi:MAG: glucosaminidase domain-containing protein [Acidaminococcaceae bacterium]